MPRPFDVSVESSASVEQVHAGIEGGMHRGDAFGAVRGTVHIGHGHAAEA